MAGDCQPPWCQHFCRLVLLCVTVHLTESVSLPVSLDVTVIVSLSDWQSHCIFDTKVTVTVTMSVSTGVIPLFVGIIGCDCDSVHHFTVVTVSTPVGIVDCTPVSFLVNVVLTV